MDSVPAWRPRAGGKCSTHAAPKAANVSPSDSRDQADSSQTPESPARRSSAAQGFPRLARLTRPDEFEQVLRRPDIRLRAGPLRLNAVFNRMHCARLGLVVGKKAVSRAHARNRIKRVIRDRFRRERNDMAALDLVVRVVAPIQRSELHRQLDRLFTELGRKTPEKDDRESGH